MRALGIIAAVILLAGCAGTSAGPTTAPSAALAANVPASAAPSPSPRPSPTPMAVLPGDPWVVYTWAPETGSGLYLMRQDGRDSHEILPDFATWPNHPNWTNHPDWSPDGSLIAFEVGWDSGAYEIWTANADGNDPQKLLGCDAAPCLGIGFPAWSPDGTELAFGRITHPEGTDYQEDRLTVEVLDLASGKTRVVARAPAVGDEYIEYLVPRWSPDGKELVFTITHFSTPPADPLIGSSIAIVRADGSEVDTPRVLTDPSFFAGYPDWSPEGDRIVFNTYDLSYFQTTTKAANLYTIHPDGTGLTQITHFGERDTRATQPGWSPDGKQIVFTHVDSSSASGDRHTAFIDPDGSNLTILDGQSATHPRLRPTP